MPGAGFDPVVGWRPVCVDGRKRISLCLGAGKCWAPHTAGLGASGASYLMCDCNYFPKKIKVT